MLHLTLTQKLTDPPGKLGKYWNKNVLDAGGKQWRTLFLEPELKRRLRQLFVHRLSNVLE